MPLPTKSKDQVLPGKEAALFKQVVKCYESKQYKKGIKAADQVLKKYPNHGETLAMKGLILNSQEKKEEAYDYVRRGIKYDITSHVSWHVYGLLYRSDREYNEAIKCYRNALRNDKENLQILRDLSWLQIHLRDIDGFIETRRQLLTLKPAQRAHWTAYAMGAHLANDHQKALQILDEYEKTMEKPENPDWETKFQNSELYLYRVMILDESGDYQAALDYLNKMEKDILDKIWMKEKKAEFLLKLGRHQEAEKQYRELLSINSENKNYHVGLHNALKVVAKDGNYTEEQLASMDKLYLELLEKYPKSDATHRYPLNFLTGDRFKDRVSKYLQTRIRKAIPSLFIDLKSLYSDPSKVKIIEEVILSFVSSLEKENKFPGGDKTEAPDALLWTNIFLAQHYDTVREPKKALEIAEKALAHTPTVIELYSIIARIYKHAGDVWQASNYFEKAREMDLADRYLNTKSSRYLLRSNQIERAISTLGLFTKDGDDVERYLSDMQCMWFETECGEAYYRLGKMGQALKKLTAIDKHFSDFIEDQFDFHTYSLRKMTLRSYIKMLRFEDNVYIHKYYVHGAKDIVRVYLDLHEKPPQEEKKENVDETAGMTEEEKKKYLKKKKKEEARKQQEKEEKEKAEKAAAAKTQKGHQEKKKVVDPDPEGKLLVNVDVLAAATKFIQVLQKYAPRDVEVQILAFDLYSRKKKYLLMLQALKRALKVAPEHPQVQVMVVKFFQAVQPILDTLPATVKQMIATDRDAILGGKSLQDYSAVFIKKGSQGTLAERLGAAQVIYLLDNSKKAEALKVATSLEGVNHGSVKQAVATYRALKTVFGDDQAQKEFKAAARTVFPYATEFMEESELKAREEKAKAPKQTTEDKE